jgi:hypothetical protein
MMSIKEQLGCIEGHLKELNGKTIRNTQDVEKHEKEINEINKRIYYATGVVGTIVVGIQLGIKFIGGF